MTIRAAALTDVGMEREQNEDALCLDNERGLYIVADGVGGSRAGEVASRISVELTYQLVSDAIDRPRAASDPRSRGAQIAAAMRHAVTAASEAVYTAGRTRDEYRGMACTVVMLHIEGNEAIAASVGDSRLYLVRDGELRLLTEDHTIVREMLLRGMLSPEQARDHQYRSVLSRSVGDRPTVDVDVLQLEILPGDRFLLCSDGLSDMLPDSELLDVLDAEPPERAVHTLVALANEAGGYDNITAIAVEVSEGTDSPDTVPLEQKVVLLGHVFLFRELSFQECVRLLRLLEERRFAAGDAITVEGEPGDTLFVVVSGECDVTQRGVHLTTIGAGGHFGEFGLIRDGERTATVTATSAVRALALSRQAFHRIMHEESRVAARLSWAFLQNMAERLVEVSRDFTRLSQELQPISAAERKLP
jgi:serine/threonine protein phosphatase PrpC